MNSPTTPQELADEIEAEARPLRPNPERNDRDSGWERREATYNAKMDIVARIRALPQTESELADAWDAVTQAIEDSGDSGPLTDRDVFEVRINRKHATALRAIHPVISREQAKDIRSMVLGVAASIRDTHDFDHWEMVWADRLETIDALLGSTPTDTETA